MHDMMTDILSVCWTILAGGLMVGIVACLWRMIPRREE